MYPKKLASQQVANARANTMQGTMSSDPLSSQAQELLSVVNCDLWVAAAIGIGCATKVDTLLLHCLPSSQVGDR